MAFYENLGFSNHPFAKTNADEEPNLKSYFVPPPYFDSVVGDALLPCANIILAPRGAGKTAQRRMVENYSIEKRFLAVTYDRFEFAAGETIENITLQYHLRNILIRILISYLSYASESPDVIKQLSKKEQSQLSLFINTYLGDLTGERLQELMKELKSLPEKFKEFWSTHIGVLESVANFLLKQYDFESIDLPNAPQEEKRLSETYKYQLEILLILVKKLGFSSIYVLVDRPDETELTGNDPGKTYLLIKPLLKDLELLGLEGYGFKFFLWDQIEPFFRKDARPDRIAQYKLKWTMNNLKKVLSARLKAFSGGTIADFNSIMTKDTDIPYDIDDIICLMSNGSPRNMIRMCEKIFSMQAEKDIDSTSIDITSFDQGIIEFSEVLFIEKYGEELLKVIQRIGRELFTINYIANDVLKISTQAARNKVAEWTKVGLIKQVGTVSIPTANRPLHFYCVIDPITVRLINRKSTLREFLDDRWITCEFCNYENLFNVELYPPNNDPICIGCGRTLL